MKPIIIRSYVKSSLHVALSLLAFCNVLALQQGISVSVSMQCALFGFGLAAYKYTNQFVPALFKRQSISVGNIALLIVALAMGFWGLMAQPLNVWWLFFGIAVLTFCLPCLLVHIWVCGLYLRLKFLWSLFHGQHWHCYP